MKCPKCSSEKTVKNAPIPLKKNGIIQPVQRYKCKKCGYQFTKSEYVKYYSKEIKVLALRLLQELSYREIAKVLDIDNHSVIHYWDKKDNEMSRPMDYDNEKLKTEIIEAKAICEYAVRINYTNSYYYQKGLKALNKLFPNIY